MKIDLIFVKHDNGFDDGELILGRFRTKKSAYLYVKLTRKFYTKGYFKLCIVKKDGSYYFETVNAQDILNV